jgi:hypothetical protein
MRMKKFALCLTLPLLTSVAVVGLPTVASADTPGCVTKREFARVNHGMTKARVARIFDTHGKQTSFFTVGGDSYEGRSYRACHHASYAIVSIDYKNRHEVDKFAYWG